MQALFRVDTLDGPLVSPGNTNHMLRCNAEQLDSVTSGMQWNLHNNLCGTAFTKWHPFVPGDHGLARFKIFLPAS